jgi:hypothetical protein
MQKQQEEALLANFRMMDAEEKEMLLTLSERCASRKQRTRPPLRLVTGGASPAPLADLLSAMR